MALKALSKNNRRKRVKPSLNGTKRRSRGTFDGRKQISAGDMRRDLNIIVDLIPRTNSNRPGTPLHPTKITIHNTDNDEPGADARAHARYMKGSDAQHRQVSWHFSVDDQSVYQSLPVDEVGWHAGNREGNASSIGIEICQNRGIDQEAANDRAAKLAALMLDELQIELDGNVVQHNKWSGKNCPALLRNPSSGWTDFLEKVERYHRSISANVFGNNHRFAIPFAAVRAAGEGTHTVFDQILEIAANSDIARYEWRDRGRAPLGYIKGMALVFSRVYCKLKVGDPAAVEMAKADSGDLGHDAVTWYREQFAIANMDNSISGPDTLRHLFVLLTGLGMRESSGNYCEGRDMSAHNTSADTAEAGLFQTSYNARTSSPLLPQIFRHYLANPSSGFLDIFKERAHCTPGDFENHGTGPGREFQRLSKECPAFAVEFAAVGLRNVRSHWGPVINRKAEIRPACDEMFRQVQRKVDESNLCPLLA